MGTPKSERRPASAASPSVSTKRPAYAAYARPRDATSSTTSSSSSTAAAATAAAGGEENAAVLGVAINTRNYHALLARAGDVSSASSDQSARDDGYNDNTVVGLPVETRNYMALLHPQHPSNNSNNNSNNNHSSAARHGYRHHHRHGYDWDARSPSPARYDYGYEKRSPAAAAQSPVAMGVAVDSSNLSGARPRRTSNQLETETIIEDEDAVLGLPINTGNYLAMKRNKDGVLPNSARQRSYSGLDGPTGNERPSLGGRRSTPDYGIAAPRNSASGSTAAHSADSCFDMRRTAGAIVPYKGWLYIQSKTMKSWKRYYAVLSGLDFRYCPEPGRASKGFGMVQSIERWDGKPWGIRLVYTSGNQVFAYCVSEQDREEWIDNVNKAVERLQNSTGHSKTTYTLAADQHEGYLYKQDRTKKWVLTFFTLRNDGYMQCRDDASSPVDPKSSGYVRSVAFADVHTNALAIELASGESVFVYTETYDDRMLWYAAISALANATTKVPHAARLVKSSYVQTALPNHSGWLYKQTGIFKAWKRVYCTLHGLEFGFAKDVNAAVDECGKVHSVEDWDGKQHGLEIRFANGAVWKVHTESYETAKHWRSVITEVCRHADRFNIKNYLASRRRKKLRPVFGGWLTTHKGSAHVRRFYVVDGNMLGVADDVDNLLQPIGSVVDIGATRDTANGILMVFADGSRLKVSGDSLESAKAWYDCISAAL